MIHSRWKGALRLCLAGFFWMLFSNLAWAQQCVPSQQCNTTCCQAGEACHLGKCVRKGTACKADSACKSTEYCEPKLGNCMPRQGASATCEYRPPTGQFKPSVLWQWRPGNVSYKESMVTPVVMAMQDTNNDGKIDDKDIPFVAMTAMRSYFGNGRGQGAIRVFRGTDGKLLFTAGTGIIHGWSSLALGDVDGDGKPEIIAKRYNTANGLAQGVYAFDNTGKVKWVSKDANGRIAPSFTPTGTYVAPPYITDLDGDGKVEILVGSSIFRGSDGRLICTGDPNSAATYAADMNGDGKLEIVSGNKIFDRNCKALWTNTFGGGITGIADFNKDGKPEIVSAGGNYVRLINGQTGKQIAAALLPSDRGGKGPSLGDVDGDGIPEIGVGGRDYFHVFKVDYKNKKITALWKSKTKDYSSSGASSSMFDFNADGKVAVVYNDEIASYIFDGLTGKTFYKGYHRSGTVAEYPIIVDVNGDGKAERVSTTSRGPTSLGNLVVLQEIGENWVNTRPVWNQYQYHITNICTGDKFCPKGDNKFGVPPKKPLKNWTIKGLNNFRLNAYSGHSSSGYQDNAFSVPDLAIRNIQTQWKDCKQKIEVMFQVSNLGSTRTRVGLPVTVYQGTASSKVKLTTVTTTRSLAPGAHEYFQLVLTPSLSRTLAFTIVADDNGANVGKQRECNEKNNGATKPFFNPTKDPYCLGLVNDRPVITGTPATNGKEEVPYTFKPGVTDPDPLNKHTWTLPTKPAGATVDPKTGAVSWLPGPTNAGKTVTFKLQVCDDGKPVLCGTRTWTVKVARTNNPPQIVGTPLGFAWESQIYAYNPRVVDKDAGDTHKWSGKTLPAGATVDSKTGAVRWTPKASDRGKLVSFVVEVCDQSGLCASQGWRAQVGVPNRPPQIQGAPGTSVAPNTNYGYLPRVLDPDVGDKHTWKLEKAPAGAVLNPTTGKVDWLPATKDNGKIVGFTLSVCDRGNLCARQSWSVLVGKGANTPPQMVLTPANTAIQSKLYLLTPKVVDPDKGDTHLWKLKKGPSGAKADPKTGRLTWTPGSGDVGKAFTFELEVCDKAGACHLRQWIVRVLSAGSPPEMVGVPKTLANPDKLYTFAPSIKAPVSGETYRWNLQKGPTGATVDPKTGRLTWTPRKADIGKYFDFALEVCDSKKRCAQRRWKVRVTQGSTNTPPVITTTPPTTGSEGVVYLYNPMMTDPDQGDSHTWKLLKKPVGVRFDPRTGALSWFPTPADVGKSVEFTLSVCDKAGRCDTQTWKVSVGPKNLPPVIVTKPPTSAYVGKALSYKARATDKNPGDVLSWRLTKAPAGATLNRATGELTWKPTATDKDKAATFELEVCDNGTPRLCQKQTFVLTPRQPCQVDVDCKGDRICLQDKRGELICVEAGCAKKSPRCAAKTDLCQEGSCKPDPCQNKSCKAGEFCRSSDGRCAKPCAGVKCAADQRCVDGTCTKTPCAAAGKPCKAGEVCSTATPFKPACVKNPCSDKSCRHGRVCDEKGRCVDNPCEGVTCPDSNQQRCVLGQCVERKDCKVDVDCEGDEVCLEGKCRPGGCYLKAAACKTGSLCLSGECKVNQCPTPGGSACKEDEYCRPGANQCVPTCANKECPEGERCVDGACKKDPCAGKTCPSGFVCVAGTCEKSNCAGKSNQCKHGRSCSEETNGCTDDPCAGVQCPGENQRCVGGQCVARVCQFDSDCKGDDLCLKGKCVPSDCQKDSDCKDKERCVLGKCVPDSCAGKQCKEGEYCRDGSCVPSCAGVFCPAKQVCVEGICKDDPCADVQCKSDETCVNGKCVSAPCKGKPNACKEGRVCKRDKCEDDPCAGVQCPGKQSCEGGQCKGERACKVDIDCPGAGICVEELCKKPGCYNEKCEGKERCQDGVCEENPCDSKECPAGEVCRPADGTCVKSCPKCASGERCVDGQCQEDPCNDVTCDKGQSCDDGACQPDVCGDSKQPCRYGRSCSKSACKDDLCAGMVCPNGGTCREGVCVGSLVQEPTSDASVADKSTGKEGGSDSIGDLTPPPGCDCRTTGGNVPLYWFVLFGIALAFRRRRTHRG